MRTATFDSMGLGLVVEMNTEAEPNEEDNSTAPNVPGVIPEDLGPRGGWTDLKGVIFSPDLPTHAANLAAFQGKQVRGNYSTLTNHLGTTYPRVKLREFRPVGRIMPLGAGRGYAQRYEARFFHCFIPV